TQLSGLQVTAQVNEADIANVKVGQPVNFTVDAYPNRMFAGQVAIVQPLGQAVQNVVSYAVISSIEQTNNANLLPGMTASANIITDQAKDVLEVPMAALTYARGQAGTRFAGGTQGRAEGQTGRSQQVEGQSPAGSNTQGSHDGSGGKSQKESAQRQDGSDSQSHSPGQRGQFEQPGGPGVLFVLKDGKPAPVEVRFGISDGRFVQVISGLADGAEVVSGGGVTSASMPSPAPNQSHAGGPFGGGFGGEHGGGMGH
ncbi:MAG: efflux RND transporter periplasmic adaptor subunit, partial [Chloroflexota bacterium]|nr:efflux RND transporter periplasmic adaptor subunit [Chloroflexota bacterium]